MHLFEGVELLVILILCRTSDACAIECITSETGDSCIFPFSLQGITLDGCVEAQLVNNTTYSKGDYLCPLQYNQTTGEYFDFKLCGDVGGSCSIAQVPACFYDPCQNGATCQDTNENFFRYTCDCGTSAGFIGQNCSAADPCSSNTCNGGACSVTGSDEGGFAFECNCSVVPDFLGDTCSISNPCGPSNDPCNGGACSVTKYEGSEFSFACNCSNVPDYIGDTCSIKNPCKSSSNPCNGGICTVTGDSQAGFGFWCDCSPIPQFIGDTCSVENPCSPDPCDNGGICEITGDQQIGLNFLCNCSSVNGFLGRHCNISDPCTNPQNPCNSNPCVVIELNDVFEASCSCPQNGTVGDFCDPDPCFPNTCNGGECTVTVDQVNGFSFDCNCSLIPDQLGETCSLDNPCIPDPCNGGVCELTGDQHIGFDFLCNCSSVHGFLGKYCNITDPCTNTANPCNSNPCTAIVSNESFEANCSCPQKGTVGQFCDADPCFPDTCNGGQCTVTGDKEIGFGFQCNCSTIPDVLGETCAVSNPCRPDPCNGGVCKIIGDELSGLNFSCNCSSIIGSVGSHCNLTDPCLVNHNQCNSHPCTVVTKNGSLQAECSCPSNGTVGDWCDDDPCLPDTCNGGQCRVTGDQQELFPSS